MKNRSIAEYVDKGLKRIGITSSKPMLAIMCVVFGIMVMVFPNLLVWIVGLFLVIQGALLLINILEQKRPVTSVNNPKDDHRSQCGTRKKRFTIKNGEKEFEQAKQKESHNTIKSK